VTDAKGPAAGVGQASAACDFLTANKPPSAVWGGVLSSAVAAGEFRAALLVRGVNTP